jgi:hypothetical protein
MFFVDALHSIYILLAIFDHHLRHPPAILRCPPVRCCRPRTPEQGAAPARPCGPVFLTPPPPSRLTAPPIPPPSTPAPLSSRCPPGGLPPQTPLHELWPHRSLRFLICVRLVLLAYLSLNKIRPPFSQVGHWYYSCLALFIMTQNVKQKK